MNIKLKIPAGFYKEETRSGYTVSEKMKIVWAVELDLLSEYQRVCEKYGLKYWACDGTLLGAVRHKGFIPWDDDVDIHMPRDDYEVLCKVAANEFDYPYFFQTSETDIGFGRTFAKIRNSGTTGIQKRELKADIKYNQGIFIDILPLDNVPDDGKERYSFLKKIEKLRRKAGYYSKLVDNYSYQYFSTKKGLKKSGAVIGAVLSASVRRFNIKNPYTEKYREFAVKYNDTETKCFGNLLFYNHKAERPDCSIYERKDFTETLYMDFEMLKLPVPSGFDNCLRQRYGDWKTPVQGMNFHGDMIFDPDTPYTEFVKN